jgi:hypothetical protein
VKRANNSGPTTDRISAPSADKSHSTSKASEWQADLQKASLWTKAEEGESACRNYEQSCKMNPFLNAGCIGKGCDTTVVAPTKVNKRRVGLHLKNSQAVRHCHF